MNTYDFDSKIDFSMNNKLFCTFTTKENLDNLIKDINSNYTVLYNKLFVLYSPDHNEYICTYNIDTTLSKDVIFENTILVHRKKTTNTLYTINALNKLIKNLNEGILDHQYPIDWQKYSNRILLTQNDDYKEIKTEIHEIINF